jgi:hypothetical protein
MDRADIHVEVVMFRKYTFAAIVIASVALSAPASTAAYASHGFGGGSRFAASFGGYRVGHWGRGDPPGIGFAGPRGTGFDRFTHDRSGYDGDRYWYGGDCFPTEPGGCD